MILPFALPGFPSFTRIDTEQIVFTMINSGVLIMLVVEWLEEVGFFCEETMQLDSRADNGSCERRAKFGAEENVAELLELLHERGGKLRGRKNRERGEKLRGRKKIFSRLVLR